MNTVDAGAAPGLRQTIGLFQAIMYGTGLILGAGIYVLIGDVAGIAGNAMWVSFILAAVIATLTGLSYAELASMFPKSAAEYVFVKNAFGSRPFAFLAGWLIIFVAIVSAAAVAAGFSGYLAAFLPGINPVLTTMLLIAALSGLSFAGIRGSAWTNTTFTLIKLAGLGIIIGAGVFLSASPEIDYFEMPPAVTSPATALGAVLGAAGLVFFAYFGFENLANISEETKNPRRTIPIALIASIVITTAIYVLVAVSAISLAGWKDLSSTGAPLGLVAERVFGRAGMATLSAIALFATANTVLMLLVAASRIIFGMAADRAFPRSLAGVHAKTRTPFRAIVLVMVTAVAIIAASSGSIGTLANVAVFSIFIVYAFVNLSLIMLRYKRQEIERPFRSPGHVGRFPVLAGLGLVSSIVMLTQFDWTVAVVGLAATGAGMIAHLLLNGRSFSGTGPAQ
ncbi:MAG: APC family permease [Nitrososphaera sp.]|jgi:APA family basic amino acid/polyamine antiporter